jgi:hypothetical protein
MTKLVCSKEIEKPWKIKAWLTGVLMILNLAVHAGNR